jgi:hypothetical protein
MRCAAYWALPLLGQRQPERSRLQRVKVNVLDLAGFGLRDWKQAEGVVRYSRRGGRARSLSKVQSAERLRKRLELPHRPDLLPPNPLLPVLFYEII